MPPPRPAGHLPGFGEQHDLRRPWPSPVGRVPYLAAAAAILIPYSGRRRHMMRRTAR